MVLYDSLTEKGLRTWLNMLEQREEPPTEEHVALLNSIVERLIDEAVAAQANNKDEMKDEQPFYLIHGVPGARKSRLIRLLREVFEKVLGWQHGVQFVCIAFQNVMAAAMEV